MADIVERLRHHGGIGLFGQMNNDAADEIEQLRKFARYIMNEGDHVSRWVMSDKAREALSVSRPHLSTPEK